MTVSEVPHKCGGSRVFILMAGNCPLASAVDVGARLAISDVDAEVSNRGFEKTTSREVQSGDCSEYLGQWRWVSFCGQSVAGACSRTEAAFYTKFRNGGRICQTWQMWAASLLSLKFCKGFESGEELVGVASEGGGDLEQCLSLDS